MEMEKVYACIDLKSFYASVECVERGLDPLNINLVVADESRTDKTICLAVSPALKSFGVPGRPRLFEVRQKVNAINEARRIAAGGKLYGESDSLSLLKSDPKLALSFLVAPPRMAHYIAYSTRIVSLYLRFIAPEDLYVYSIDEVFMDITGYLNHGETSPHDFVRNILKEIVRQTGITATAGIGSNLYLAKIAMDITAKHMPADSDGVRIAQLTEQSYRETLWEHRPITDFWRVGKGIAKKLAANGMTTMGDIALCSVGEKGSFHSEELLYSLFGVNAELLIDHAWGYEPCTLEDIRAYKPGTESLSSGQVLTEPYSFEKAKLVAAEMAQSISEDLVKKRQVTSQLVLTVGYDAVNLSDMNARAQYTGEITADHYGRAVPKAAHGTENLLFPTSSSKQIVRTTEKLFDRVVNRKLLIRRINIAACRVENENSADVLPTEQLNLFTDYEEQEQDLRREEADRQKERSVQQTVLEIKSRFGKNAIVKGIDLENGATAILRNGQIGGHKA